MCPEVRYRRFGRTGWAVSQVSLGTVELGVVYGFYRPDEPDLPDDSRSVKLLRQAFDEGINLVDTAPGYGRAEELLGRALSQTAAQVYVATKVSVPAPGEPDPSGTVRRSLETSLERLRKDRLDLVQVHNATAADLSRAELLDPLLAAREEGLIEHLGASVYGVDAALAAVRHPEIAAVQVAYSLLDRRMEGEVLRVAAQTGTAVLVRSALLKGALTERCRLLPARLARLREAAEAAWQWADEIDEPLPGAALRFCLSRPEGQVGSVLVGLRPGPGNGELHQALAAAAASPLTETELVRAEGLALDDADLIDPRSWGLP